jgi:glucose uptake protein
MILPQTSSLVMTLMVLSLLFLGIWASMFKAAGKWRFELFYFDFAFGLLFAAVLFAFTLGDLGYDGFSFIDDLQHAGKRQWVYCFIAGMIFNLGNMLLMGATSVAGMSVAFPLSLGIALLMNTLLGLTGKATGNPTLILLGCVLILTSVVVNAIAYRIVGVQKHEQLARAGLAKSTRRPNPLKGIVLAILSGILIGSFGGLFGKAREGDLGLGPYASGAVFAFGVFFSTFVFNIFFMNLPVEGDPVDFGAYFKSRTRQHVLGLMGGFLWFAGTLAGLIAVSVPETLQPTVLPRFLMAQGPPVIAALLGIIVWKEIKGSDVRVRILAAMMIVLFVCGLAMIGLAPLYLRKAA